MHRLTTLNIPFSFSFMSYSYTRDTSHGIVAVLRAVLLPGNVKERNSFNDYMLRYRDLDTYEEKSCWQLLLLTFNGEDLTL